MSNENGAFQATPDATEPDVEAGRWPSKEALAALLVRFLGVFFTARAVTWGTDTVLRLFVESQHLGLNEALRGHGYQIASLIAELSIGLYLIFGGQWVFDRLLMPAAGDPSADGPENVDERVSDDQGRT